MTQLTSIFIGDDTLTVQCAEHWLDRGHTIKVVVTSAPAVTDWAKAKQLRVELPGKDLAERLSDCASDWLFSVAYLSMIKDDVLALASKGAVNFHDGPLPGYAGLNTPVWAMLNGETEYGITWHSINSEIDKGDVLIRRDFTIDEDATALSLNTQCFAAALESFEPLVEQIETDSLEPKVQDFSDRKVFMRSDRPAANAHIDFSQSAEKVAGFVRALDHGGYWNPLAVPKLITPDGKILLVSGAEVVEAPADTPAGQIVDATSVALTVACQEGAVALSRLTDIDGAERAPFQVAAPGATLKTMSEDEAKSLDEALRAVVKAEGRWRKSLHDLRATDLPDVCLGTHGEADWHSTSEGLPKGLSEVGWVKVLGLFLRHAATDPNAVDIALSVGKDSPAPLHLSDWVPMRVEVTAEDHRGELEARLQTALTRAKKSPAYARDLIARDPQIKKLETPVVGLVLGGERAIEGTALTLSIADNGAVRLWGDGARVAKSYVDVICARLSHFATSLDGLGDDALVSSIPAMPDSETSLVKSAWNQTDVHYDADLTMAQAFEAQVLKTPDSTALIHEGTELTYAELNAAANKAAHVLQGMGVEPNMLVGLCTQRSPDLVIGALAILKAGGGYVPIDPAYPADRIALYLEDSAAEIVVTQSALAAQLPEHKAQVLALDDDPRIAEASADNPSAQTKGEDLAYVIYTSGSTGRPKGVMVEHRNVSNFFVGMDARVHYDAPGTWLAVTSLSFDISVLELFWTLARGFRVVLMGDDEGALVSGEAVGRAGHIEMSLMYWGNDDGVGRQKYEILLEGAKFADANGFNAVWTPERHFHAFGGPYPNPAVTGAAVAAVTKNLEVRSGSVVSPLHHPIRIAEEWAVIDNLTNGRTGLAVASGWHPEDFVLRPQNEPPNHKPAMYESMEQIRKLWRGEKVEFPLKDGRMIPVLTQPRPVSEELRLWVTVAGNPDTWREAGRTGCHVLTHLLGQSIDEVKDRIVLYHDALREAGHDPADFEVSLMLHTYVAEDRETAREVARQPMKNYLTAAASLVKQYAWAFPAFKRPEGIENPHELDLRNLSGDEVDAILEFAFMRYFEDSGLFGSVEDCVARIDQVKAIGVTEVACLIDYGIPRETVLEGLRPLAEVLRQSNVGLEAAEGDYSIAAQVVRHEVTHMQCTPSMARMIMMNDEARIALSRVEHLMIGGEALPGTLAKELAKVAPKADIENMYGPTETTIWSTTGPAQPDAIVSSIGTPIANTQIFVLDADLKLLPVGAEGDLWIAGAGVTRGYWQRDELTTDRFRANPFGEGRMYMTGDRARWTPDGKLEYAGRSDQQVKLRGYRIEMGEIEAAAEALPQVRQAVAVVREDTGDPRLVLYVTGTELAPQAIRSTLGESLPAHMVPSFVVPVESFPLTPNRKVDRKALPEPGKEEAAAAPAPAPAAPAAQPAAASGAADGVASSSEEVQETIAKIWAEVLRVPHVAPGDNFFTLGGHSLLAVQAHREIRNALGAKSISITDVFRYPKLEDLAAHVGAKGGAPAGKAAAPAAAEPAAEAAGAKSQAAARADAMSKRRAMRARRGS